MSGLLAGPAYWDWWLLGFILIILEMLLPGTFMVWLGSAALVVGLLVLLFPTLGWQWQWLLFALLSLASLSLWWAYFRKHTLQSAEPWLNRRGYQYIGRVLTLNAPIVNGQGKVRVDDSIWKIVGADCPAGTRVRVIGVDGVMLKVEPEATTADTAGRYSP